MEAHQDLEIRPQPLRSASSGEVQAEGEPIRKAKHTGSTYRPHFDEKASCTHEEQLLVALHARTHNAPRGGVANPSRVRREVQGLLVREDRFQGHREGGTLRGRVWSTLFGFYFW